MATTTTMSDWEATMFHVYGIARDLNEKASASTSDPLVCVMEVGGGTIHLHMWGKKKPYVVGSAREAWDVLRMMRDAFDVGVMWARDLDKAFL